MQALHEFQDQKVVIQELEDPSDLDRFSIIQGPSAGPMCYKRTPKVRIALKRHIA